MGSKTLPPAGVWPSGYALGLSRLMVQRYLVGGPDGGPDAGGGFVGASLPLVGVHWASEPAVTVKRARSDEASIVKEEILKNYIYIYSKKGGPFCVK